MLNLSVGEYQTPVKGHCEGVKGAKEKQNNPYQTTQKVNLYNKLSLNLCRLLLGLNHEQTILLAPLPPVQTRSLKFLPGEV